MKQHKSRRTRHSKIFTMYNFKICRVPGTAKSPKARTSGGSVSPTMNSAIFQAAFAKTSGQVDNFMERCARKTPPPPFNLRSHWYRDPFPRVEDEITGEIASSFISDEHALWESQGECEMSCHALHPQVCLPVDGVRKPHVCHTPTPPCNFITCVCLLLATCHFSHFSNGRNASTALSDLNILAQPLEFSHYDTNAKIIQYRNASLPHGYTSSFLPWTSRRLDRDTRSPLRSPRQNVSSI